MLEKKCVVALGKFLILGQIFVLEGCITSKEQPIKNDVPQMVEEEDDNYLSPITITEPTEEVGDYSLNSNDGQQNEVVEDESNSIDSGSTADSDSPIPDYSIAEPEEAKPLDLEKYTIYFNYDDHSLSSRYKLILDDLARALRDNRAKRLTIEGNCDERGTEKYNMKLGKYRALAVKKYLLSQGVHKRQLSIISRGEEDPVSFGQTESNHKLNRRASFVLSLDSIY